MISFSFIFLRALLKLIYGFLFVRSPSFGLHKLDRKLHSILSLNGLDDHGFFIEIGANDGITQSNTLYLQFLRSWRGLLVEPLPAQFFTCFFLRSFLRNTITKNYLCSSDSTNSSLYSFVPSGQSSSGLTSSLHLNASPNFGGNSCLAPFTTLDSICFDLSINSIDFFSLDVEGHELDVLKGFTRHISITKWLLVEVRDSNSVNSFLSSYSFAFYDVLFESSSRKDILFYNTKLVDPVFR